MQPESKRLGVIGQRLEIGFGDGAIDWLPSRLEDHDGTGERFTVAWPTDSDRRFIPVEPGASLQVSVPMNDAIYSATTLVEAASRDDVPLLTLKVIGEWQRTQRRNAVRVAVAIRPRIAAWTMGDAYRNLRLGITNISATGVQVRSQDELRHGDLIALAFELMGVDEELQLEARVCRVQRYERVWDAGCEFVDLPDRLARRIVQFIFAQQRALVRAKKA